MKEYFHPHYIQLVIDIFQSKLWTIINYFFAHWWKIKIGKYCKFKGKTIFRTLPNSKIIIGNACSFNSSYTSNQIGVYSPCMISTISKCANIQIGNNCGFSGTVIAAAKSIRIGNNVRCGSNTMITDTDWHNDDPRSKGNKEVIIEDNVWLGYGVKVLKGVRIGKNTLIGANSIVIKDIPSNVIAAGNPCKIIQEL